MSNEEKNNKNCDERRFIIFREDTFPDGRKDRFILHIDGWYHCKNEEEGFAGGDEPTQYTRYEAEKIIKKFEKDDITKRPLYYMKELKYFKEIERNKNCVCDKKNK